MLLHGANDGTLCQAFSATLRKSAWRWFSNLQPRSISSFEQLGRLFINHFISSRRQRRTLDMLIDIKQKESESLREFITRFNAITLEVSDLDQTVAMSTMKGGLRPTRFSLSLEKWFSTSFIEMLARAEKYANAEEAMSTKRSLATLQFDKKEKEKSKREEPSSNDHLSQVRGSTKPPLPKFHNYTPLNAPQF